MVKEKLVRIRKKTHEAVEEIAIEEDLSIGELVDRVLTEFCEGYWETDSNEESGSEPAEEEPEDDEEDT